MTRRNDRQFDTIFKTKTTLTKQKTISLMNILKGLFINPLSEEFRQPLDWQERGLVNYNLIIHQPMDLTTVKENLKNEIYHSIQDCLNAIELIFQNSRHYNRGTTWIEELTDKCEKVFLKLVKNYLPEIKSCLDVDNKKAIKVKKFKSKEINGKSDGNNILIRKENIENSSQKLLKLQEKDQQQTALPSENGKSLNKVTQQEQNLQYRTQFFNLIKESSQHSLQITYLIIKSEDVTLINTERNGNCRIDVTKLSQPILIKLISFLKEQKEKEQTEKQKQNIAKRKRNYLNNQKSRYDI